MSTRNRTERIALVLLAAIVVSETCVLDRVRGDEHQGEVTERVRDVLRRRCLDCHNSLTKEGGFNIEPFMVGKIDTALIGQWVRIHDRVRDREMPPKSEPFADSERAMFLTSLGESLVVADKLRRGPARSTLRRLNRNEYENTLRDLLDWPALDVRELLPADGRWLGYDKSGQALEFSTVQINKYLEAAGKALPLAIAPYSERDEPMKARLYPGDEAGIMDGIINGCGLCLKDFKFDADLFPLSVPSGHVPGGGGFGFFEQLQKQGKIPYRGAVGFMRNGDDYKPDFSLISPVVPGYYKVRASLWGFRWDKGEVKPTTPQIGRFFINGQYSGSKNAVIGYFDAPSLKPTVSEVIAWLTPGDSLCFQPASIRHDWQGIPYGKLDRYTGDGVAVDWLEVEGPLVAAWPAIGHQRLFGDLPLTRIEPKQESERPRRRPMGQWRGGAQAFKVAPKHQQVWTAVSTDPARCRKAAREFFCRSRSVVRSMRKTCRRTSRLR